MLKKKLLYKEDKSQTMRMKQENDIVQEEKVRGHRGRQLPGKQAQKNTYIITSSNKRNKDVNSKSYKVDSFEEEEEYESSDSDCSIRNNRKRELLKESIEIPENLKYSYQANESFEDSQELMENYEGSDDLTFSYEDNLSNEVERILIDIYNNNVTTNSKAKIDITKYEKHVTLFYFIRRLNFFQRP